MAFMRGFAPVIVRPDTIGFQAGAVTRPINAHKRAMPKAVQSGSRCLHIVDFPRYFYGFRGAGSPGGLMTIIRAFRAVAPLALAAAVGLFGAALAQKTPPAKTSRPAAKSTRSETAKSETAKSE